MVAGDFNVTTAVREAKEKLKNSPGEMRLLERLRREFKLYNAWQALQPNQALPQTLRWAKNPLDTYHCDAIFVSESHLASLRSAEIANSGVWGEISDHSPVIVTIE